MGAAGASRFSESEVSYFLSKVCIEADHVFRFAVAITGEDQSAYKPLKSAMQKVTSDLKNRARSDRDDNRQELTQLVWNELSAGKFSGPTSGPLAQVLSSLDTRARAILVASDVLGLSTTELAGVFKISESEIRTSLAASRLVLCGKKPAKSPDLEFFMSHIGDFLDETSASDVNQKMDTLMKQPEFSELSEEYQRGLGQLQVTLQGYFIGSDRMQELYELVETPDIRQTQELARIEETERSEFASSVRKRILILLGLSLAIFAVVYYSTSPKKSEDFDPIRYLSLETIAMIEDPSGRLDYLFKSDQAPAEATTENAGEGVDSSAPTVQTSADSVAELQEYFDKHPELDFKVKVMKVDPKVWDPVGGAVFDYDGIKVTVVLYRSKDALQESMVHYSYKGQLTELPASEPGELKQDGAALRYQAYGSDNLNIVAWQENDGVVGMMMGTRGAADLARTVASSRKP